MAIEFGRVVPTFRIFSVDKAREFYLDFLGFKVDWEHRFEPNTPLYAQVSLGDCRIHLSEHHGDAAPGSAIRIAVDDIDARLKKAKAAGATVMREPFDVVGIGRIAILREPGGAGIGWMTPVSS